MPAVFRTVGLLGKYGDPTIADTLNVMHGFLVARGLEVLLDETTARSMPEHAMETASCETLGRRCDLIIVVGGDGTMLTAARALADYSIPVVGINLGRLGFLVDISPGLMLDRLDEILQGRYVSEERFLLEAQLVRNGEVINQAVAFNDVVVHKWNTARIIEFATYINSQYVDTQRSDGLIVSTPTGSTAYALSGGGPILHPTLDAMVLVPICPHTLSNRPIVVQGGSLVEVVVRECHQERVQVTCDGLLNFPLVPADRIRIKRKEPRITLIHPADHDYFKILRTKLKWGSKMD